MAQENEDYKKIEKYSLWLKTLSLQNYATFENQNIQFSRDFCAIVGETGSGKSLILDALQLIFGGRADKKIIRKDAPFSSVEATFHCEDSKLAIFFEELGYPFENNEIVIKRIIWPTGITKSFINYQACNLQVLSTFAKRFIDIVGQFDNQKLLSSGYQLVLLDLFANIGTLKKQYDLEYQAIQKLEKDLHDLYEQMTQSEQRKDYLRFQINEIKSLDPSTEDENELLNKKQSWQFREKKVLLLQQLNLVLSEGEESSDVISLLRRARQILFQNNLSSQLPGIVEDVELLLAKAEELSYVVSKELTLVEDQSDMDAVLDRLDKYQKLKRKFGGTTDGVLEQLKMFQEEIENIQDLESKIAEIKNNLESHREKAWNLASTLHEHRIKNAKPLSQKLTEVVQSLKMTDASIKIEIQENTELGPNGFDFVQFCAETNPGEGFHPIKEIASGGELSRILLSVRTILATKDTISIFLFDEIDTGVGGETALAIGKALSKVSHSSQVIAITHLPQIATHASTLIHVTKESIGPTKRNNSLKRTYSSVREVVGNERNDIIKQMMPLP